MQFTTAIDIVSYPDKPIRNNDGTYASNDRGEYSDARIAYGDQNQWLKDYIEGDNNQVANLILSNPEGKASIIHIITIHSF